MPLLLSIRGICTISNVRHHHISRDISLIQVYYNECNDGLGGGMGRKAFFTQPFTSNQPGRLHLINPAKFKEYPHTRTRESSPVQFQVPVLYCTLSIISSRFGTSPPNSSRLKQFTSGHSISLALHVLHILWQVTQSGEWRSIKIFSDDPLYINRVFLLLSFSSLYHNIHTVLP